MSVRLSLSQKLRGNLALSVALACFSIVSSSVQAQEYLNGIEWKRPDVVSPGKENSAPPSDAIVLFDGKDLSKWENGDKWKVEEGNMVVGKGEVRTKDKFGDCQLHIEWSSPKPATGQGQGRGNSGIFLMGRYEIQVLDSFNAETYYDGQAGAIYKQTPPMANAMRAPGEWNTYDIVWTTPKFNADGSLKSPAYITAIHNGVLILNHFELKGDTPFNRPPKYTQHEETGPISLQDHGNPVRFRNIWIRPIKPVEGKQVKPPFIRKGDVETPIEK